MCKLFLLFLLAIFTGIAVHADEPMTRESQQTFLYGKVGAGAIALDTPDTVEIAWGIGVRTHRGWYGWDLSVDLMAEGYRSNGLIMGRGLGLLYLTPRLSASPYVGIGLAPGARTYQDYRNYEWCRATQAGLFGEAVVGYEWLWNKPLGNSRHVPLLLFTQFNVHQPALIYRTRHQKGYAPSFTLELGIGF